MTLDDWVAITAAERAWWDTYGWILTAMAPPVCLLVAGIWLDEMRLVPRVLLQGPRAPEAGAGSRHETPRSGVGFGVKPRVEKRSV